MHLQNFLFSKFSLFDTLKYKKINDYQQIGQVQAEL